MPPARTDWRSRPRLLPQPFTRTPLPHPTSARTDRHAAFRPLPYDQLDQGEVDLDHVRKCEQDPAVLRRALETRAARLERIDPELVRGAIYTLLAGPPQTYSHPALAAVHHAVNLPPPSQEPLDSEGNPWSLGVLVWLDVILVLYQPVSAAPLPSATSTPRTPKSTITRNGITEADRRVFGALTATSLAARVLILIPHAHESVLRGMWVALIWMGLGYGGSKRGIAVDFLLERLGEEWKGRERKTSTSTSPSPRSTPAGPRGSPGDGWMGRMREVERRRAQGSLGVAEVWEILSGDMTATTPPFPPMTALGSTARPLDGLPTSPIYPSPLPSLRSILSLHGSSSLSSLPGETPTYWRPRLTHDRSEEPTTHPFAHLVQPTRLPTCAEETSHTGHMVRYEVASSPPRLERRTSGVGTHVLVPHRGADWW